jgi:hypothetical protein
MILIYQGTLANNHRARSSKPRVLALVSVGLLLLWTKILSRNHVTVACFVHVVSQLLLQTAFVGVVSCFPSDCQTRRFVRQWPLCGPIFVMCKSIKARHLASRNCPFKQQAKITCARRVIRCKPLICNSSFEVVRWIQDIAKYRTVLRTSVLGLLVKL